MKFSVIIPVYNAAATLRESLDSVAAQTHRHFEVVLVNDGSTDASLQVFEDWKKQHPEIETRLVSQENRGLGAARNTGVEAASHKFVAFLDADDIWHPQKLELTAESLHHSGAGLCYHAVETFGTGKTRRRQAFQVNSLSGLLVKGNPIVPSAVAGKRQVFLEFPFSTDPKFHGAEDLGLWIRLLAAGKKFNFLNKILLHYRESGGMSTRLEEHLQHVKNVLNNAREEQLISPDLCAAALRRKEYEAARFCHKRGRHLQAKKHYRKAHPLKAKARILSWLNRLHLAV